jgi:Fe-S cluster biosynthesis and repair protein YggX
MSEITCSKCGGAQPAMPRLPFPGELGALVQQKVCAVCWKAWLSAQVNLINEHRYVMTNPDHRAILNKQMREFLGLPAGG